MNAEANHYQAVYMPSRYQPPTYEEYISNTENKQLEYILYLLHAWNHQSPKLEEHMRRFMFDGDFENEILEPETIRFNYNAKTKRFEIDLDDDLDDNYDPHDAPDDKSKTSIPKQQNTTKQPEEHPKPSEKVIEMTTITQPVPQENNLGESTMTQPTPQEKNLGEPTEVETTDSSTQDEIGTTSTLKIVKKRTFVSSVDHATEPHSVLVMGYRPILGVLPTDSQLGPHNDEYFQMFTNNKSKIMADKKLSKIFWFIKGMENPISIHDNLTNTNPHLELANFRQLFETLNINSLKHTHNLVVPVKNRRLYKLIDVGSCARMIRRDIECDYLIPTIPGASDHTRIAGRQKAIVQYQNPNKRFFEQTIQQYAKENSMTIDLRNAENHRMVYNKICNFTDVLYYIDNKDLGEIFMTSQRGLVAIGTMHIYKKDGPVEMFGEEFGYVTSDEETMTMKVEGNPYPYCHSKRFPELMVSDITKIAVRQRIGENEVTLFELHVIVTNRVSCGATDYIAFYIIKVPHVTSNDVKRACAICFTDTDCNSTLYTQYASTVSHKMNSLTTPDLRCPGTILCPKCLEGFCENTRTIEKGMHCLQCFAACTYSLHGISKTIKDKYLQALKKKTSPQLLLQSLPIEQQPVVRTVPIPPEQTIMYYRSKFEKQKTTAYQISDAELRMCHADPSGFNFIAEDGAAVVALKQQGYIATFTTRDWSMTDTLTWASYKNIVKEEIFLIDALSLAKTIRTSYSSYNPTDLKDLQSLCKLVLSNAIELPARNAMAVVAYIMKLHLDMSLEATKLAESHLAQCLKAVNDGKFTYTKPSFMKDMLTSWNNRVIKTRFNKVEINSHVHKNQFRVFGNDVFNFNAHTDTSTVSSPHPTTTNNNNNGDSGSNQGGLPINPSASAMLGSSQASITPTN